MTSDYVKCHHCAHVFENFMKRWNDMPSPLHWDPPDYFCCSRLFNSLEVDNELQVCEVYKLHRETYYMCVDYVDRFLSRTSGIKKTQLQLIGVTALFIAAKMEVCKTAISQPVFCDHHRLAGFPCILESPWIFSLYIQGLESTWKQGWYLKVLESESLGPWKSWNFLSL